MRHPDGAGGGSITAEEAIRIHATGHSLAHLLDTDTRWWSPWDSWLPGDPPPSCQ